MANKREFKKIVEYVGDSTCGTMAEVYDTVESADKDIIAKSVEKVLCAVAAAKSNADITFDKGVKAFDSLKEYSKAKKSFYRQLFKKIIDDFNKEIEEAVNLFNTAIPQDVKEGNKAVTK